MNQQRTEQPTEQRTIGWPDVHVSVVRVVPRQGEGSPVTALPSGDRS